ncbi:MAG: glycosyltransferase [Lachnospiraceae bacterium]|nr:glycosyltransferase [Lachnospiraceae bacterium]
MRSTDIISVIVPCFNAEKYVAECLDSILEQDFPLSQLQLILVNDASADHTQEILAEYERQYPDQVLLINCPETLGPGASRNIGMKYATGEYITFIDADDTILPDMLTVLYEKATRHHCEVVRCGYRIFSENGTENVVSMQEKLFEINCTEDRRSLLREHGFRYGNAVWAKLYKTAFLRENNLQLPEHARMEDIAFHQEVLCRVRRFYVSEKILYNYRKTPGGIMLSPDAIRYFMDVFYVQRATYEGFLRNGLNAGLELELAWIFYYKGFVTPMEYMLYGEDIIPYDREKIDLMCHTLFHFFPDILRNPYILADNSEQNKQLMQTMKDYRPSDTVSSTRMDILVIRGGHGGFENIISEIASYLSKHHFIIRFVQVLPSEYNWTPPESENACLGLDDKSFQPDDAANAYADLLRTSPVPDLIVAAGWPYTAYIAKAATARAGFPVPVVYWAHGDMKFYEETKSGGTEMMQYADICFAISRRIATDILDCYPDKVVYRLNNTYNPARIHYAEERNTLKLACVGRLSQEKAIPFVLYALEMTASPWELYLAGNGEEEAALRKLARELRIEKRVHFLGWMDNPWQSLADCRALVVSSLYEGAPLTVLEALASGMQVISTPAGFIPEIIRDGENGYLYPFGNPRALADVLDRIGGIPVDAHTAIQCKESVSEYLPTRVMWDTLCKMTACARRVFLPQRYSAAAHNLLVSDKASVLIHRSDFREQALSELLQRLEEQTIEKNFIEIIVKENDQYIGSARSSDYLVFHMTPEHGRSLKADTLENWYMDKICHFDYHAYCSG